MKYFKNNSDETDKKISEILHQLMDIVELDDFESDEATLGYIHEPDDKKFQSIQVKVRLVKKDETDY